MRQAVCTDSVPPVSVPTGIFDRIGTRAQRSGRPFRTGRTYGILEECPGRARSATARLYSNSFRSEIHARSFALALWDAGRLSWLLVWLR